MLREREKRMRDRQSVSAMESKWEKERRKKTVEIEKMFCQRKEDMKRKDVSSLLRIKYRYICLYAIVS